MENARKKTRWGWLRRDTLFVNQKLTTSDYALPINENWGVNVGGFICTDLFWDNRLMVDARDGGILLYPTAFRPDINNRDINATPSFNLLAMNSRISLRISVPSVWSANISGFMEGWFMGVSNTGLNGFALRHSYIKMDWEKTALLVGQTWHPMFTENCFASTLAASTGAPFQPFSRAPQIRFTQKFGKALRLMAYANTQLDHSSTGFEGASSQYLRHSSIPEMGLQFQYGKFKNYDEGKTSTLFLIGIGVDYKRLTPRLVTGENKYTKKGVDCGAAILFTHYKYSIEASEMKKKRSFGVKAKGFYGGGCNEMLMIGGYAVKKYNDGELSYDDDFGYMALNMLSGWLDLYMELGNWEFGIFSGYCKNLGAYQKIQDSNNLLSYWGRGIGVNQLYRASMRAKYNIGKLQMGFEPEYTLASYGSQFDDYGKVVKNSTDIVHGVRLLLSATLFF
ncbi:MAG: hypothetical protein LBV02_08235 [Bacteroidales bacterium]|nr:hypothetical protein [Bacteroidales bacterium]